MYLSKKGFSLLEVLVAIVIVSISLTWSLYILSEALNIKKTLKEREDFNSILKKGLIEIIFSKQNKNFIKDDKIILEKDNYKITYQFKKINILTNEILLKLKIKEEKPSNIIENILEIPLKERNIFSIKIILAKIFALTQDQENCLGEFFILENN